MHGQQNIKFVFTQCALYYCHILIKFEFSEQIFEKFSSINFMQNHPVRAELLFHADGQWDRQTDGHVETNSRFSQFSGSAKYICPYKTKLQSGSNFIVTPCI